MQRRVFSREFKVEAVKLVRDRGVAVAQASRDLEVAESVLRRWMRDLSSGPVQAFPGRGQMKPEQQEIDRLRREVAKLKAEREILKRAAAYCARGAICSSPASRRIARSGRWLGFARHRRSRARAFTPG
jgi:transposase